MSEHGQNGERGAVRRDDWAEDQHDVEVQDEHGRAVRKARLAGGVDGIARFHELIAGFLPDGADPSQVLVCIETDRGPWVRALVSAGYQVFGLNPKQAARRRELLSLSGGTCARAFGTPCIHEHACFSELERDYDLRCRT
jgi:Transposase